MPGSTQEEVYKVWASMFRRAYSPVYHDSKPTYVGVEVAEAWHKLSDFKPWFDQHYVAGWQLDKDILVPGNRLYSPATCCFVPREVNSVLIGRTARDGVPSGVYFKKRNQKFCAQYSDSTGGRATIYLGLFDNVEEASAAYRAAKEAHVRRIAEKHKNWLRPDVYNALRNWAVNH